MKHRSWPLVLALTAAAACDLPLDAPDDGVDAAPSQAAPDDEPDDDDDDDDHEHDHGDPPYRGAVQRTVLWDKSTLSVCFNDGPSSFEDPATREPMEAADSRQFELETRALIQQAVDSTWGAKTRFHFQWLGTCGPAGADIRIKPTQKTVLGWAAYGTGSLQHEMQINFPCTQGGVGHCTQNSPDGGGLCNLGTFVKGQSPPADQQTCVRTIAVHEFGHALGLMHEHERIDKPASCLAHTDGTSLTGMWDYDPVSRMNYCWSGMFTSPTPKLSAGDIRTISTLYPPQVKASGPGSSRVFGPGVHTSGPWSIRVLVISPGLEVKLCDSNNICNTYTESIELVTAQVAAKVVVTPRVWAFEHSGYRGRNALYGVGVSTGSKINAACNDCISSVIVPHGLEARLCWHEAGGAGDVCTVLGGGPEFEDTPYDQLPPDFQDQTSFIEVTPKVVLYRDRNFKGIGKSLAMGAKFSNPLTGASSLIVHAGYHARVCTAVVNGNGAGTCQVLTASDNLNATLDNNVAFLETYPAPLVWEPPPGPGPCLLCNAGR